MKVRAKPAESSPERIGGLVFSQRMMGTDRIDSRDVKSRIQPHGAVEMRGRFGPFLSHEVFESLRVFLVCLECRWLSNNARPGSKSGIHYGGEASHNVLAQNRKRDQRRLAWRQDRFDHTHDLFSRLIYNACLKAQ